MLIEKELPKTFSPHDTVELPRLATIPEVCEWLSLSRMQVFRLMKKGTLRFIKFGTGKTSSVRFILTELIEDIEKLRGGNHE